jgi:hypothetical protein
MNVSQKLKEIRVYEGVAECTGLEVDRSEVRRNSGLCGSLSELMRKARNSGDGTFYLPADQWPADTEQIETRKPWVVIAS